MTRIVIASEAKQSILMQDRWLRVESVAFMPVDCFVAPLLARNPGLSELSNQTCCEPVQARFAMTELREP